MAVKISRTIGEVGPTLALAPRLQRAGNIRSVRKELQAAIAWIDRHEREGWKVLPEMFVSSEDTVITFNCYKPNLRPRASKKEKSPRRKAIRKG